MTSLASTKDSASEIEQASIQFDETVLEEKSLTTLKDDKGEVSSKIWVPLSLVVAVLFAVANISVSYIASYRQKAIALQSVGSLIGNLIPLIVVSIYSKKQDKGQYQQTGGYFKWFYNIFLFRKIDTDGNYVANQWTTRIQWKRVAVSVCLLLLWFVSYLIFIISYSFAGIVHLNTGVLMSIYSVKPVVSSIIFFFLFKQALKSYEFIAMVFCIAGALVIGLSSDGKTVGNTEESTKMYSILACSTLCISLVLTCVRAAVLKYFFGTAKEVNISALFNFIGVFSDVMFLIYFIALEVEGFEFALHEYIAATVGGIILSLSGYLIAYVNVRGKAGVADALIETSVIYQTVLEIALFSRFPNTLQYIGLILGFGATLFLILCNHVKMS
ncbi:unnamed protein product [Moneuplotes crassus]|uniref:Uncharacterized protein n=1 Tax=Euplotes crassus TaxID=5936 RepID=A0AAD1UPA4_EUPCR|nr:unnamed protein product [Moneuplotes crassus]